MSEWVVAKLTWQLVGASLFIGYPSSPVVQVCVDSMCFAPSNPVMDIVEWTADPPVVRAQFRDGSWCSAVPWPSFSG